MPGVINRRVACGPLTGFQRLTLMISSLGAIFTAVMKITVQKRNRLNIGSVLISSV
jgi:hypothetical protein